MTTFIACNLGATKWLRRSSKLGHVLHVNLKLFVYLYYDCSHFVLFFLCRFSAS